MLSDSCHSGTVSRARRAGAVEKPRRGRRYRFLPVPTARAVYRANKGIYDAIQLGTKPRETRDDSRLRAAHLGCEDHQLSSDGDGERSLHRNVESRLGRRRFHAALTSPCATGEGAHAAYQQPRYSLEGARECPRWNGSGRSARSAGALAWRSRGKAAAAEMPNDR